MRCTTWRRRRACVAGADPYPPGGCGAAPSVAPCRCQLCRHFLFWEMVWKGLCRSVAVLMIVWAFVQSISFCLFPSVESDEHFLMWSLFSLQDHVFTTLRGALLLSQVQYGRWPCLVLRSCPMYQLQRIQSTRMQYL